MNQQDRAVTPVVSTILVVAIVVILAATVSVFFFDVAENINEPAPNVADTKGEFEPEASGPRQRDNQIVRITHIAGEGVAVEELEILIRASGPGLDSSKETRLVELPATGSSLNNNNIKGELVSPNSGRNSVIDGDDGIMWSAGQTIAFRINTGKADFRNDPNGPEANKLEVIIIHTPSNAIISENTFRP